MPDAKSLPIASCCNGSTTLPKLRAADGNDLPVVESLLKQAALPTDGVRDFFPDNYAVAELGQVVIGAAGVEQYGSYGLLRSAVVAAGARGTGLGAQLVHDRLQWSRSRGITDVYLLTTTAPAFFEKFGFGRVERSAVPGEVQVAREFASICPSSSTVMHLNLQTGADVRAVVRQKYGAAARAAAEQEKSSCCGSAKAKTSDPITSNLYEAAETNSLPDAAVLASQGCGNPTALAQLAPGETVLDLGSGGGIDVLLSAKRVGPTGKAYGLDMTDEMLALARENQRAAGVTNVEFLKGEIESIPLPDESVDVIISNCVINLSADKPQVIKEAFRVLKSGGRFAVSDVVVRGAVPEAIRRNVELWVGCVAGALEEQEYLGLLRDAGFVDASIEPTRVYSVRDALGEATGSTLQLREEELQDLEGKFISGFVRATKP
ncbi:MAG TPA: arsenic resistance N-acetyltransferase ArsN2 [Longimicrobiales bacterium]